MKAINTFLTVTLVAVVAYVLFKPSNRTPQIIGALGGGSRDWIRTLSGQYPEGGGYSAGGY